MSTKGNPMTEPTELDAARERLEKALAKSGWSDATEMTSLPGVTYGDLRALTAWNTRPSVVELEPDWAVSKDGPIKIGDQRRWLARQLMDSKLTDEEAFGIVCHHPNISDMWNTRPSVGDDGYKLVPVEPTEAMLRAGYAAFVNSPSGMFVGRIPHVYAAMLLASQED
jgi:hypothetical protein